MPRPQELVQPRVISYFKSSWYARWVVIVIVASSFWFLPGVNRSVAALLAVLATTYNLLLMLGSKMGWTTVTDQRIMLAIDSLLALLLVVCTNGAASPYFLVLVLVIVSGSYWYGAWVSIANVIIQTVALEAVYIYRSDGVFSLRLLVQMMFMATIGVYVSWLTGSERSERNKLISVGTETEKERLQLLALINNMRDAVIVIDNNDNVVIHNQAAAALAGPGKDIHNQPINQALQFVDAESRATQLKVRATDGESEQKDLRVKAPDGSLINTSIRIAPYIVDRQNRGHVLIVRDTSQEKTIDKEREEFIAVASHELRTPLTIAQSSISFLLAPPYLPEDKEAVKMLN